MGGSVPTQFSIAEKVTKRDKQRLLAVYLCGETGTMLKADAFALAKTKNPAFIPLDAKPAFIPLGDAPSVFLA